MGRVFLQCEDKKQLQRQEYLLRDDWKDVLQYWLYVLFHEGDRNISKQAASGCQNAINHICCKLPVWFRKSAGDFICKSQNFSFSNSK